MRTGWGYKTRETEARWADARRWFEIAYERGNRRRETYRNGCQQERELEEWTMLARAAECAVDVAGNSREFLFWAGYARSRLARVLATEVQQARSEAELYKAEDHLLIALRTPAAEGAPRIGRIFRALVLTYARLGDVNAMLRYLNRW